MSDTTKPATVAAPAKPDPKLDPGHDWGIESEIGKAVAHVKAWILAREHANSQVPKE